MKTIIGYQYQKIKYFYRRYERWLMPAALVGGFLGDYGDFIVNFLGCGNINI